MEKEVRLAGTDIGICQGLVNLKRTGLNPFAILVVTSLLGNLADVDLGVKVSSKCLMVITGVAVYNIKIVNLVEIMLCSIRCKALFRRDSLS